MLIDNNEPGWFNTKALLVGYAESLDLNQIEVIPIKELRKISKQSIHNSIDSNYFNPNPINPLNKNNMLYTLFTYIDVALRLEKEYLTKTATTSKSPSSIASEVTQVANKLCLCMSKSLELLRGNLHETTTFMNNMRIARHYLFEDLKSAEKLIEEINKRADSYYQQSQQSQSD